MGKKDVGSLDVHPLIGGSLTHHLQPLDDGVVIVNEDTVAHHV